MRKLLTTIALAALMAGAATSAQARDGWYGRLDVGYSIDGELDTSFEYKIDECDYNECEDLAAAARDSRRRRIDETFDLDDGWMVSGGVGYAYGNGFRAEGELAHRQNDIADTDAEVTANSLMINGLYDFNRGGRFQPSSIQSPRFSKCSPRETCLCAPGIRTTGWRRPIPRRR